jgi:hypothetical protein
LLVSAGDEIVPIPEDDNNTYYWVEWYSDNEFGKPELIDFDIDDEAVINSNYLQATVMCRPELIKTSVYAIVW